MTIFRWLSTDKNLMPVFNRWAIWEIAVMPYIRLFFPEPLPRPYIRKRGLQLQSSTGYTRVSIQSWDRWFSDGASGNLLHRNCDRIGDSSCCSTTRWALPNRNHLHSASLYQCKKMSAYKVKPLVTLQKIFFAFPTLCFFFVIIKERPQ